MCSYLLIVVKLFLVCVSGVGGGEARSSVGRESGRIWVHLVEEKHDQYLLNEKNQLKQF